MSTYVAFLRAVNVGGRVVKMEALRKHLADAGFGDVETYIQSGNVRLTSGARSTAKVEQLVEDALREALGFEVATLVRKPGELRELVRSCPPSPLGDSARHYVSFLREAPATDVAKQLNGWDVDGERLAVVGRDLHMWLDKPTMQAQISNAKIEKMAKMAATNRNWTVVSALAEKWGGPASA
jgi:uncharacterized protein (DUF1697 family)